MYKIELELKHNKWYGTFHRYTAPPFSIELSYLSIIAPKRVVEDMKARNPNTKVFLKETS